MRSHASYRSIADLLTQHCLPTSKTAVAQFCHQVLGENVRPRKRPVRKRPPVPASANGDDAPPVASTSQAAGPADTDTNPDAGDATQARARGPRIAQVRILKPQTT